MNHEAAKHIKLYKYKCLICSHLNYTNPSMGYTREYITTNSLIKICQQLCSSDTQTQVIFTCTQAGCIFQAESPKAVATHEMTHNNARYRCRPCDLLCPSVSALRTHVESKHVGCKLYLCGLDGCPKSYDSMRALQQHYEESTHSDNTYECYKCRVTFVRKSVLQTHLNLPICPSLKCYQYRCDTCHRSYVYLKNYKTHMDLCLRDMLNLRKLTVCTNNLMHSSIIG